MTTAAACYQCAQSAAMGDDEVSRACDGCQALVFRPTTGPLVCVAYENADLRRAIGENLWSSGFSVCATTGAHVMQILTQHPPQAIALDVGLDVASSHDVIQFAKQEAALQSVKIVLVASVYNKAAYKRRPTQLYGADDYVDQHQIEQLPRKVAALLNMPLSALASRGSKSSTAGLDDLSSRLRVRALSQSIVADIALYHNAEVEQAIRTGAVDNLRGALDEGRRLLAEMAHLDPADSSDPLGTAFMTFIDEMRRGGP